MPQAHIREDDVTDPAILALLREHLDEMYEVTPHESVHALDVDALRRPGVTFWSQWEGEVLLGCGALKALDAASGEIKSMRTSREHRGRGLGTRMLAHILAEARRRGYARLYLETGAMDVFEPARRLYARHGFRRCGPFGDYVEDPNSVFMTRTLP